MSAAYELLRNAPPDTEGSVFDFGGAFVDKLQISATAYGGSVDSEFIVEWSYYDKTSGPWEMLHEGQVSTDEQTTVVVPVGLHLSFVRARHLDVATAGPVSVKVWAD